MGQKGKNNFQWSINRFLERRGEDKKSSTFLIWGDTSCLHFPGREKIIEGLSQYYTLYVNSSLNSTYRAGKSLKICLIGRNGKEVSVNNRILPEVMYYDTFLLMTLRHWELIRNLDSLLPGGTLTVRLLWYEDRDEMRPMEMLETLSRDLSRFHISNANTDCVLRVGETEIPAHRGILSSRSEVFGEMFRHETSENRTGVVDILDADPDVISDFLKYIYSGKVHGLIMSTAAPLFVVADKYGLKLLQEACLSFLTDNLTVGNICDAADLAYTYGEEELERKVVQFIGDGIADVQGTAEWKKFALNKHPLAIKLLTSVIAYKDTKKEMS